MFDDLLKMAQKENERQNNEFLPESNADVYWEKIKNEAEFNIHVIDGKYAGFVAFYCNNKDSKESYITLIMVSPKFRGKKIGSGLIDYVLAISRLRGFTRCSLEVKKTNKDAINIYESKGFSVFQELEKSFIMKTNLY